MILSAFLTNFILFKIFLGQPVAVPANENHHDNTPYFLRWTTHRSTSTFDTNGRSLVVYFSILFSKSLKYFLVLFFLILYIFLDHQKIQEKVLPYLDVGYYFVVEVSKYFSFYYCFYYCYHHFRYYRFLQYRYHLCYHQYSHRLLLYHHMVLQNRILYLQYHDSLDP